MLPSCREPFRACGCGASYSFSEWRTLRRIGFMAIDADDVADVELRICAVCRSSITVEIPYVGGSERPPAPT